MDFPFKILIIFVIGLVATVIIIAMISGWGKQGQDLMSGMFDFFSGILGFGGD